MLQVDQGYVKKLILWNGILCRNEGYGDERSGCVIESTTSSSETTGRVGYRNISLYMLDVF